MQLHPLDPIQIQAYTLANRRPRRSGQQIRIVGVFLSIAVYSLFLISCSQDTGLAYENTGTPAPTSPTRAPERSETRPAPTSTIPDAPTASSLSCLSRDGTIEVHEIRHPAFVAPIILRVYLPPCYAQDTFATYPVLILLHGLLATDSQWEQLGVTDLADQIIHAGESPPFIIFMPWIRNSQDPRTAVEDALIPYAREQWRLADEAQYWAIGGISRGAGQALQIGLLNTEQFRAIGLHSPAILHAPDLLLSWYLAAPPSQRPSIWLDIGRSDSLTESVMVLVDTFRSGGVQLTLNLNQGEHTRKYWMEHLPAYLDWYRSFWIPAIEPDP